MKTVKLKNILTVALLVLCLLIGSQVRAQEDTGVSFNFVDVELGALAKFISDVTGKNFVFDERLRGKITVIAPTKLKSKDAFKLFTSVLNLKGFTLVPSGVNAYNIVPIAEASRSGIDVTARSRAVDENFIVRIIQLENIESDDALRFLQPVISRNGHISAFGPGNLLMLVDSGLNVQKIMGIVNILDVPQISEEPEVVFLENSSAEDVAKVLNEGMQQKKTRRGAQTEEGKVVAETRLNALVLFGPKSARDSMKRLLALLDVPTTETHSAINVYFLENADAEELAEVLQSLMKGGGRPTAPGQRKPPGAAATAASPFEASNIVITPDRATNSLVIVASPSDYQSIVQVIQKLDRKRKQVFVEAMIVEASLDKLRELGSRWRASATHNDEPVVVGGVGTVDSSTIQTILSGLAGMTVGGVGNYLDVPITRPDGSTSTLKVPGFAALFSLSEFKGAVNVLSSPQILTSDNTEAEILVGQNVPFVTQRETTSTAAAAGTGILSAVERQDVGIKLRITPQITEGDYVKLDIYQEISAVQASAEAVFTSVGPTTTKRSTKTTVAVQDGQTVVIGGLMQEEEKDTVTRVPLLHRIPLLGWLFKFKSYSKTKTNLLVFINPHIVREAEDLERITKQNEQAFAKEEQMYAPRQLLVKFRDDVSRDEALEIMESKGFTLLERLDEDNLYLVEFGEDLSIEDAMEEFNSLPQVKYAEPNYVIQRPRQPLHPSTEGRPEENHNGNQ